MKLSRICLGVVCLVLLGACQAQQPPLVASQRHQHQRAIAPAPPAESLAGWIVEWRHFEEEEWTTIASGLHPRMDGYWLDLTPWDHPVCFRVASYDHHYVRNSSQVYCYMEPKRLGRSFFVAFVHER